MDVANAVIVERGVGEFRPKGECDLVTAADLIGAAIEHCRRRATRKLLIDGRGLTGVPIPTLVDRFLMVEEWARKAQSMVVVALVIHAEYIHKEKFGVMVAHDFGLTCNVFTSEAEAFEWLRDVRLQ